METPESPYVGEIVHYVVTRGNVIPAIISNVLEVNGDTELDPIRVYTFPNGQAQKDMIERSEEGHIGTWHEITSNCDHITVVDTPS